MGNKLSISIITPTFNRADELDCLLRSISKQTHSLKNIEFIVSDDGSHDKTEKVVNKWQKKSLFDLIYIRQENKGPGAARNHGLEKSRGDIILFIDSDCEAHPKWIEVIMKTFKLKNFDAFGGPDGAKDDFTILQKAIDFSMTSFFTTGGMRGHSKNMIAKFYPRTHNMGITKDVYQNIGGFGNLRHGQDIEYSNRIYKSGAKALFIEDALVYHRRRTSLKQFMKQVFNWGVARVNLGKLDSSMLEPVHFLPSLACFFSIITILFTLNNGWSSFDIFLLFLSPLFILSLLGSYSKRDPRIFPFLLFVIPIQIVGYGIGFLQSFIQRFILNKPEMIGFKKNYYK